MRLLDSLEKLISLATGAFAPGAAKRDPEFIIDPNQLEVIPDDYDVSGYGMPKPATVNTKNTKGA